MKKRFFLPLACLLAVLIGINSACADALSDWNAKCTAKMKSSATVYSLVTDSQATATDISDGTNSLVAIGSVSSGAYVQRGSTLTVSGTKYRSISYFGGSGYVKDSAVTSATVSRQINATSTISVPEAIANDASAIAAYAKSLGATVDMAVIQASISGVPYVTASPTPVPTGSADPSATVSADPASTGSASPYPTYPDGTPKPTATPEPAVYVAFYVQEQVAEASEAEEPAVSNVPVEIIHLGTVNSLIRLNGEEVRVPTSSLVTNHELNAKKAIGIIKCPKSGRTNVYTKPKTRSDVITKLHHGTVVLVINAGKSFSLVWANGTVGYVKNAMLTFQPLDASTKGISPTTGLVSYKGKIKGDIVIDMRATASNGSRSLGDFRVGSYVEIFGEPLKGWYEVEIDGVHGYMPQKYVTPDSAGEEASRS